MGPKDYAKWGFTMAAIVALAVLVGLHRIDWPQFMAGLGLLLSPSVLQKTPGAS